MARSRTSTLIPPTPANRASFFVVKILTDEGDGEYTFQESLDQGDGTLTVLDGGRYGGPLNPGVDVLSAGFAVDDPALCRQADGRAGTTFELYPIGATSGSNSGGGSNCSWLSAALETDCFALTYGAGDPIDLPDSVTINGTDYAISFDASARTLSLGAHAGERTGCDCPCVTFAFKRSEFFPEEDPAASVCDRLFTVKVCQTCCPIDGWAGPGWYCVRTAGTEDDCVPAELLEADKCDDTIEICSGPYADEEAATAVCGTATCRTIDCNQGGLLGQYVTRCGGGDIPCLIESFKFTISGVTDGTQSCGSVNGTFVITWTGGTCGWLSADNAWQLTFGSGGTTALLRHTVVPNLQWTASISSWDCKTPLTLTNDFTGGFGWCGGIPATLTITPCPTP